MSVKFNNQDYGVTIINHEKLPLLKTNSFNFYRCVQFQEEFYNKTISELHAGNLRLSGIDNRYSTLFPGQKLSYWADSPKTARAEVKKWGANNNLLTFRAYDDGSSFIPTIYPAAQLIIINGIELEFHKLLEKINDKSSLTKDEQYLIDRIGDEEPDCLAYKSEARDSGICYLFFEKGFRKLSLREVSLRLGEKPGGNHNIVKCATGSDYSPNIESYGFYFMPITKLRFDEEYKKSDEYKLRKRGREKSLERITVSMK